MRTNRFPEPEIDTFCLEHLGEAPSHVSNPGGEGRKTVLVTVQGQKLAISKRASAGRAALEANILSNLGQSGFAPKLVLHHDRYVVQEAVNGDRLSLRLELEQALSRDQLIQRAAKSLLEMQSLNSRSDLTQTAPKIGIRTNWALDFSNVPYTLADSLNIQISSYDANAIAHKIKPTNKVLVKWDARPGNALVSGSKVVWFDWEHCGLGSVEDDLVWFLGDEWTPISSHIQDIILRDAADRSSLSFDELLERFAIKMCLHGCVRLGLIFRRKGNGSWWNPHEALEYDRVGVTRAHVRRVCKRAFTFSNEFQDLKPLSGLFRQLAEIE